MGIRLPLKTVLSFVDTNDVGAGSVAGGVPATFTIPQDSDNIVVKLQASIVGGGVSATVQTTDDNGTTWWDVARSSVVSNASGSTSEWMSIPVISPGIANVTETASSSIVSSRTVGSAAASSLGSAQVSGLPLMSTFNRVFLRYSAGVSANALTQVDVKVNSESAQP